MIAIRTFCVLESRNLFVAFDADNLTTTGKVDFFRVFKQSKADRAFGRLLHLRNENHPFGRFVGKSRLLFKNQKPDLFFIANFIQKTKCLIHAARRINLNRHDLSAKFYIIHIGI